MMDLFREDDAVRGGILVGLVLLMVAGAAAARDEPGIFPLEGIRSGMRGVGRTVVSGTRVEEFPFEVLGVTRGPGFPLVLFRASGPLIRRSGGIAAGMSGSPMYLQGRIAGALSYGYASAGPDSDLGLFTPIEAMLDVLRMDSVPRGPTALDRPVRISGRTVRSVVLVEDPVRARRMNDAGGPVAAMTPVTTPLLVSGIEGPAFRMLRQALESYPLLPLQVPVESRAFEAPLVPGSAIGAVLVRGDVSIAAIGTLTYREGRRFLAFGHPLLGLGEARYLLTPAYVHAVVRSTVLPFKLGDLGPAVGVVRQDRRAAIGGEIGSIPPVFSVQVTTTDVESGRSATLRMQVVSRRDLVRLLVPSVVLSAIQRGWDAGGEGTAEITVRARGIGLPREAVRTQVVYSPTNAPAAVLPDVLRALRLVFRPDDAVRPVDLRLEVKITRAARTAVLVDAEPQERTVTAGETLRVKLRLRPTGGPPEERTVELPIPPDFPRGSARLVVIPAGLLPGSDPQPEAPAFERLEEEVTAFETFGRNTDVVVQLLPADAPPAQTPARRFSQLQRYPSELVRTPWAVGGEAVTLPITVR
ncbi:MAG: hypothetical protein QN193_01330 [Armatimonadota bacterium]|nr:hypothetical protein [Armatimonadota bacterium]MDR7444768.1 hypothetical protein [Armatimonadota bacterium]MDR7569230.1 hypothetical protein [Armatimonadota bacterium]MDR7613348.1 hypothetical protein [Armatimonadota bacterium]